MAFFIGGCPALAWGTALELVAVPGVGAGVPAFLTTGWEGEDWVEPAEEGETGFRALVAVEVS